MVSLSPAVVFALLALLLGLPWPGQAATYRANSASAIKSSINGMRAGDTLLIAGGTYDVHLSSLTGVTFPSGTSWADAPRIQGAPGETVIIKARNTSNSDNAMVHIQRARYLILDNLILDAAAWAVNGNNSAVKLDSTSNHIRLQNSTIKNARGFTEPSATKGILLTKESTSNEFLNLDIFNNLGYGIYLDSANNLIEGCRIHDNSRYGLHVYEDNGGVNNNVIRNNHIYNNGDNSAGCWSGCYHAGMIIDSGSNNLVYNNVIYNNANGGVEIKGEGTQFYNNTLWQNRRSPCLTITGDRASVRNNLCYGNGGGIQDQGRNTTLDRNLTDDPRFVNAAAGDFHLQAGSPAIKAGVDLSSIFTTDAAGTRRPSGAFDLGAYTYGSPTPGLPAPRNLRLVTTP